MILVTGGTGLVGAHLLYKLSIENETIRATKRKNSDLQAVKNVFSFYTENFEQQFNKIEWVDADVLSIVELEDAFLNITQVYHCAALVSFSASDFDKMQKINVVGTANIVNFCIAKKVEKLCFVSSIATIDKAVNNKIITEEDEWNAEKNNYGYAISKYAAEMEVWRASQEGVSVVIVNPGVILGAGFWNNGSGEIFSKVKKGLNFYAEGITGFVAVTDVVNVMMQLMQSSIKNERYILVSENVSFKSVFSQIASNFNKKEPSIKVTKWMSEIGWRLAKLISLISTKQPILTKHTANSMHNKHFYSAEKIKTDLHFKFQPIATSIENICNLYPKE